MKITPAQLRDITDILDARDLLITLHCDDEVKELTGFALVGAPYKESLVGIPFLILSATLELGTIGSTYSEMHIIDSINRKVILRDSSRGIHAQLTERYEDGCAYGIWVRKGLATKQHPYTTYTNSIPATTLVTTYYLDM